MWEKTEFYGVVAQAQDMVPGFKEGYRKFEQHVVLKGLSKAATAPSCRGVISNSRKIVIY